MKGLLLMPFLLTVGAFLLACAAPSLTPRPTSIVGQIHHCSGAGQWFPADPEKLRKMVDAYLDQAERRVEAEPIAIVVPHAGYVFSGQVAAYAFKEVEGADYDVIVVIGDTHTGAGSSAIAVYTEGAFETPLGLVPVDGEVAQAIVAADERISRDLPAFANEHPIENQLPFLQRVCTKLKIVPIVFREPSLENAQILSRALVKALAGKKALIVASTDLSHYPSYEDALKVDAATLAAVESMDPQQLLDTADEYMKKGIPNLVTCFCSRGALLTAMLTAPKLGANQVTVLKYANSGDTPFGDRRQVVGYGAVMFWQGERGPSSFAVPTSVSPPQPAPLTPSERGKLLKIARQTVAQFLEAGVAPMFTPTEPGLLQERGAFVTLKKHGQLRGCIGRLIAEGPLYLTVQRVAMEAAVNDARFPPVTPDELPEIEIEISVLSPLEPVEDISQIEVGKHGLLIVKGGHQGVLLPQVATEQGWDRKEFLRGVCRKAGLPEDAWKDAKLYIFTAEVFRE